ncbi:MAG: hypothetical protein NZ700_07595, partial [Gemmataceae bacterium]|nr:hypothetical protein [Gemmataceae bacterium]MDW8267263.1 hypothetical protein [Gemmataceae bacterium]
MMRRAAITLLLVTRSSIARADWRGGVRPTLTGLWVQPRPEADDLGVLVEAGLARGPTPGRRVWLL